MYLLTACLIVLALTTLVASRRARRSRTRPPLGAGSQRFGPFSAREFVHWACSHFGVLKSRALRNARSPHACCRLQCRLVHWSHGRVVVALSVPTIKKRIGHRMICPQCRARPMNGFRSPERPPVRPR